MVSPGLPERNNLKGALELEKESTAKVERVCLASSRYWVPFTSTTQKVKYVYM